MRGREGRSTSDEAGIRAVELQPDCKTIRTSLVENTILTITELLVDNASVPAGGLFIVLLPAGGPFIFLPLVDNASVTAGGPFIVCCEMCFVI